MTVAMLFAALACLLSLRTLRCLAQSAPVDGDLRLVDGAQGPGFEYGRLEVFLRGEWGNICQGQRFTPDSAQVACRQLGYDGGARLEWVEPFGFFRNVVLASTAPVLVSEVDCDGTESRLLECSARTAAGVACRDDRGPDGPGSDLNGIVLGCSNAVSSCEITPAEETGAVRLRGGFGSPCDQLHSGFVEVFNAGVWGSIGQSGTLAPDVVCRQLGFPHGTGLEPVGDNPGPPPPPGDYDYVYDYNFYFPYAEEAEEPSERGWLESVLCTGPEQRLVDCDLGRGIVQRFRARDKLLGGRLTVACRQFAVDAALEAVTTPGAEEGDLRLVDEAAIDNWTQGRLEVFFEGSWAQVCPFAFDAPDAHVACRQLGYAAGTVMSLFAAAAASPSPKPLVFPEVAIYKSGCNGSEARLVDCPVDPIDNRFVRIARPGASRPGTCFSTFGDGLYLACVSDPISGIEEGALRLRNREENGGRVSGVLELFHAGAWGTVCGGRLPGTEVISEVDYIPEDYYSAIHQSSGFVACKQLGFADGEFEDIPRSMADDDRSPPWTAALACFGIEDRLIECPGIVFGGTEGCEATQRLTCTP